MHPRPLARAVAPLICLALVAGPLPAQASQTIRCESYNMGYRFCRADTDNRVEIARQISNTNCVLDRNWGYARNGVWVNRGCGADFRVGRGGSSSDKTAAAVVGLIGLAAIAAAASHQNKQSQEDVSAWAVGTFTGYDDREGTDVTLRIMPGGSVSGRAGRNEFSGSLDGTRLQAGRHAFRISRSGNGFLAVDERDSGHRVVFLRGYDGGGY
ncbi:MAG: DUF3011 domain-containing protein [Burkholderiaceae bacterium]|nr:MAG: DUF3011 domain-containing protein [Burkholderiaceae bacterium]